MNYTYNIFRYKIKNVETLDSISHAATISASLMRKWNLSEWRPSLWIAIYFLFATITFFLLSKIAGPVPRVILVHRERTDRNDNDYDDDVDHDHDHDHDDHDDHDDDDDNDNDDPGTRAFRVSPRWDQVFLTVATRLSASGPRSRSRPTKTSHPVPKKSLCKCAAEALPRPRRCSVGHRYIHIYRMNRAIRSPCDDFQFEKK